MKWSEGAEEGAQTEEERIINHKSRKWGEGEWGGGKKKKHTLAIIPVRRGPSSLMHVVWYATPHSSRLWGETPAIIYFRACINFLCNHLNAGWKIPGLSQTNGWNAVFTFRNTPRGTNKIPSNVGSLKEEHRRRGALQRHAAFWEIQLQFQEAF